MDVVLQHLVLEDPTQFGQRLQMNHVDDERPQHVIQRQAQLLQQLTEGKQQGSETQPPCTHFSHKQPAGALSQALRAQYSLQLGRGFGEELAIKLVLVLTHVGHEGTAAAHLRDEQGKKSQLGYLFSPLTLTLTEHLWRED